MSRREELEEEEARAQKRIDDASDDVPDDLMNNWRTELDRISFELNNLYDDDENEQPD